MWRPWQPLLVVWPPLRHVAGWGTSSNGLAQPHESSHLLNSKRFFFTVKFSIEGKQKEIKGYLDRDLLDSNPSMTESFE